MLAVLQSTFNLVSCRRKLSRFENSKQRLQSATLPTHPFTQHNKVAMKFLLALILVDCCLVLAGGSIVWKDQLYQTTKAREVTASDVTQLLGKERVHPSHLMDLLARARDKDTRLTLDYTVNDFLKLNEATLDSCLPEAFKERLKFCRKLNAWPVPEEQRPARRNFTFLCRRSIEDLAELCAYRKSDKDQTNFQEHLFKKWTSFRTEKRDGGPRFSEDLYVDQLTEFEMFIRDYKI